MIAHLVGRKTQHKDDLFRTSRDTFEADRKAVAAEDGEDDAYCSSACTRLDIFSNVLDGGVIALRSGDYGLGDRNDISVAEFESFLVGGAK